MEIKAFNNIYKNKRVLITGHTGFKGSWLIVWLYKLGAKISGLSNKIPTTPSMFEDLKLFNIIEHNICDIRDIDPTREIIKSFKPDFILHLAAQSIVSLSYKDPLDTLTTNAIGTANILEIYREINHKCALVLITSDKCYENVEWEWGYRENDKLGGKDVYSASKACAEIIAHSYYNSFISNDKDKTMVTTRAGNVIGGGDWAKDRIIPDAIRSWEQGKTLRIRSPRATRPWQHILEPLSGYLLLGQNIYESRDMNGNSFNFGPDATINVDVQTLIKDIHRQMKLTSIVPFEVEQNNMKETGLLKLSCDKALFHLKWKPNLSYNELVEFTSEWYKAYIEQKFNMFDLTSKQIDVYQEIAIKKEQKWIQVL